ncbi:hypothetical protein GCM10029992_58000 [Glycomyces albus]
MGRESHETERFTETAGRLRDAMIGVGRLRAGFEPLIQGLPDLAVLVALLVGLARYQAGALSLEQLVTVSFMFSILSFPIRAIGWVLGDLPTSVVGRKRVDNVLAAVGDMAYGETDTRRDGPASLEFASVAYTYPDGGEAIGDVSFTVEPGRTVALVGATGSGKSTLAHLAARLTDPSAGAVRLDGVDLRELTHTRLAADIALVQQIPFIFDDTVRANLSSTATASTTPACGRPWPRPEPTSSSATSTRVSTPRSASAAPPSREGSASGSPSRAPWRDTRAC